MCISTSLHPKNANTPQMLSKHPGNFLKNGPYSDIKQVPKNFKGLTFIEKYIYVLLSLPLIKKSVTTDNYKVLIFINYEIDF